MDAGFTAEQVEIRRTLRELLHKRCGPEELRHAVDTPAGHDPALWTALAEHLGLPGLALPSRYGGVGCSATEVALAAEELGRVLAPSPFLATAVLAAPLILALGTDAQRAELLPRLADGSLTAALAAPTVSLGLTGDNRGDWAGGGRAGGVQARGNGDDRRLYGEVEQVLDGHSARLLLVAAHCGGFARSRTDLFLVRGDAEGLHRVRRTALDSTRPLARLQLRDVEARLLGEEGADVLGALAAHGDTVAAVLACEAVGAAERVLELTVEYVKQREQFGRPIGSFQAVKHRLADVYVGVQAARSAAYYAAWATARQDPAGGPASARVTGRQGPAGGPASTRATARQEPAGGPANTRVTGRQGPAGGPANTRATAQQAPADGPARTRAIAHGERVGGLALAQALQALRTAAGEAIQLHGGIGFTWEHDAHLYFKRAAGDELLFGPVHRLRARAADAARLFEAAEVTM